MPKTTLLRTATLLCLMSFATSHTFADDRPTPPSDAEGPGHAPGRKPPPAAYDACAKLSENDACSVTFHEHQITGVCAPDREGGTLFCRPDHPPMHRDR